MVRSRVFGWAVAILVAFSPAVVLAQTYAQVDERGIPTIAPVLEQATKAVVNITVISERQVPAGPTFQDPFFQPFFGFNGPTRPQRQVSAGSGVIVDAKKGYVLTNNHVVDGGGQVTVTLKDGRSFQAKVLGTDPATDVAVLQIPADNLTALPLGNSENIKVGDFVVAIGNPFDLGQTVTSGIVSALGRSGINPKGYEDFIQTDASINPGNSGGALITLDGKLIGINTAIIAPSGGNVGIGFAIPVNMAKAVMEQIIKYGEVHRGLLGVAVQDLTPSLASALDLKVTKGALVSQVDPGSAADEAGLKPGDVIVAVNGEDISNANELRGHLGVMPAGKDFSMKVVREGRTMTLHAALKPRARKAELVKSKILAGATFSKLERGMPGYGQVEGVAVVDVAEGSPAMRFGLRPGDVIAAVNKRPVKTVEELDNALANAGNTIALAIWRHGSAVYLILRR